MKKLIFSLFILCSVSALSSCSDDPAASGGTIQQLFPMTVGNSWKMQDIDYDGFGNISRIDTMSMIVDSAGTVFGHQGFFVSRGGQPYFLYYNAVDLRSQDMDNESDYDFIIRYPMAANEIVVIRDTTYSDGSRSQSLFKMISENAPVSVPGGTFNCVVYMNYSLDGKGTLDTTSYDILSFAFGTGYVKQESYYRSSSTSQMVHSNTTALIKATIK